MEGEANFWPKFWFYSFDSSIWLYVIEKSTSEDNSQDSSSLHLPKKIKVENEDVNVSFESSQSPILLGSNQTSSESSHKISSPSSSNSSKKAINDSLRSLRKALEQCNKRISSLEADIPSLRTDISDMRADISQLRDAIKTLMNEKGLFTLKYVFFHVFLLQFVALLNNGNGESYTALREQYPNDQEFRIKFGEAFKEIKDEIKENKAEIKGKEAEIKENKTQIKRKEDEIKRNEDEIKVIMAEIKDKEQSLKERRNLSRCK